MKQKQKKKLGIWFSIGLLSALLSAPNGTVIRASLEHSDPFLFNVCRYGIVVLVTLPFFILALKKLTKRNIRYALIGGLCMAIAVICYTWTIKLSLASYASVMGLISPVVFVLASTRLTRDKVSAKGVAGISLAACGALIIVAGPILLSQAEFYHAPLSATILAIINAVTFPFAIIYYRKSNEAGLPLGAIMHISAWQVAALCTLPLLFTANTSSFSSIDWRAVLYSGVMVMLVARVFAVMSYEHIGSAVSGSLEYLESLLSIIVPVIVLHEQLSPEVVVGGAVILLGVYVAEHRKVAHPKHATAHRL